MGPAWRFWNGRIPSRRQLASSFGRTLRSKWSPLTMWEPWRSRRRSPLFNLVLVVALLDFFLAAMYLRAGEGMGREASSRTPEEWFEERWESQQASRRHLLRTQCDKLSDVTMASGIQAIRASSDAWDKWTGPFVVDDRHRVVYCALEKVASTSWKMALARLSGRNFSSVPWEEIHLKKVLKKAGLRGLEEYSPEQIQQRLNNYTKFLFVRHPIDRLLSAYRNKFELAEPASYYHQVYGTYINRIFKKNASLDELKFGTGVTFQELVNLILQTRVFDPHWNVYHNVCLPCYVKYDYIGHMETFTEDASFILKKLFNSADLSRFPKLNSMHDRRQEIMSRYLNTLTSSELTNLNQEYSVDMQLFGYKDVSVFPAK